MTDQSDGRLRIAEIFYSIQGEAREVGLPTVFIRLTGCPLRCTYCDTAYAFHGGSWWEIADILQHIATFNTRYICVTGGEPLAQKRCLNLLTQLCDAGYQVSLETSGALSIAPVDARVSRVMDLKTPSSGEGDKNLMQNLEHITSHDQVKFVIGDEGDFNWAKEIIQQHQIHQRCNVLFSPIFSVLEPSKLAQWILQHHLPVRMQVQLHKILWGEAQGR